jgi:hypothetical protein
MSLEYLNPDVGFLNETGTRHYLVPGSAFEDESSNMSVSVTPSVLSLTSTLKTPSVFTVLDVTISPSILTLAATLQNPILQNRVEFQTQFLIPDVGFINETGQKNFLIPGAVFENEKFFLSQGHTVTPSALSINVSIPNFSILLPKSAIQFLIPDVGFINETGSRDYLIPGSVFSTDIGPTDLIFFAEVLSLILTTPGIRFPLPVPTIFKYQLSVKAEKSSRIERTYMIKSPIAKMEQN